MEDFYEHFSNLFKGKGKPIRGLGEVFQSCEQFMVMSVDVHMALGRSKWGKSRGNSSYPLDWLCGHECDLFYEMLAHVAQLCLNTKVP